MSCPFANDDGAYVLGALAPAERAEFERHLAACSPCREGVANLAVLPGLLSRLDAATATSAGGAVRAPHDLLDRLLTAATRERAAARLRRLRLTAAAGVAALALAAAVGVGVHLTEGSAPVAVSTTAAQTAMTPVSAEVPVTAQIGLAEGSSGSTIAMTCRYSDRDGGPWTLRLVVFARDTDPGTGEQVGTWSAAAGQEVTVTASTDLHPNQIDHIELQKRDHTTLLVWYP